MKKLKKLDAKGVAHHFALAVIIVGLAVFGVYRLVAGHAETCGPMSSPVSGSCQLTYTGTCAISGVPTTVYAGETFTPRVTLTNTGTGQLNKVMESRITNGDGASKYFPGVYFSVAPGTSQTLPLGSYTVASTPKGTTGQVLAVDGASSTTVTNLECTKSFAPAVYTGSCTITNVATTVEKGAVISPIVNLTNTGTGPFSAAVSVKLTYNTGSSVTLATYNVPNLAVSSSYSTHLKSYTLPSSYLLKGTLKASVTSTLAAPFSCSRTFAFAGTAY